MATNNSINTTTMKVTQFTASGTWTMDPATKSVSILGSAGGAGGGSGRQGLTTLSSGGQGGWCGAYIVYENVPAFIFNSSETVTIGGTAAGGVTQASINSDGNAGTVENVTSLGNVKTVSASAGPGAGTNSGGFSSNDSVNCVFLVNTTNNNQSGGGGSVDVGGDGASSGNQGCNPTGGCGGGGSGAVTATPQQAGNGSLRQISFIPGVAVPLTTYTGAAGGISGGTINGANGYTSASLIPNDGIFIGGGGGGGGGGQSTTGGLVAGTGGNGGTYGAGGGGGGGSINATTSGAGGSGSRGELWVIEYF